MLHLKHHNNQIYTNIQLFHSTLKIYPHAPSVTQLSTSSTVSLFLTALWFSISVHSHPQYQILTILLFLHYLSHIYTLPMFTLMFFSTLQIFWLAFHPPSQVIIFPLQVLYNFFPINIILIICYVCFDHLYPRFPLQPCHDIV